MGRPTCTQESSVRKLIVVELSRMSKAFVNGGASLAIAAVVCIVPVLREHPIQESE